MRIKTQRIDRYILSEVFGPFLGGIAFFLFIFLMFQLLRLAEFFIVHGTPISLLGKLVSLLMITFMPIALPVAFLIGVLSAFGRLSADSELVAMKAGGISIYRMTWPVSLMALLVTLLSFGLNLEWVPYAERSFKTLLIRISNTEIVGSIKEGTFKTGFFGLLIYADKTNPKTGGLERVFIYDEREPKTPLVVVAKKGELVPVKLQSDLGAAMMMRLKDGNIHRSEVETETYTRVDFGRYLLYLEIGEGEDTTVMKPKMYSWRRLLEDYSKENPITQGYRDFRTEIHRRLSLSLAPFVFLLLGVGFGTVRTRAVRAGAAIVSLGVVIVYWGFLAVATNFSQKGQLPAPLAMQLPNFICLVGGLFAYRKASW